MSDLRKAAQALLARWDSPQWEWAKHGPTADLIADLRAALAQPEATTERDALRTIMRISDRAKEPCGDDPESPAAIRNGKFSSIAMVAAQGLGMVRGPSLAQPDQPTADGPTREDGQTAPSPTTSDRGLPEPAAYARWWEQNAYSVQQLECLRKLPEVEAYWKDRSKLALFTASQMLAFRAEGVAAGVAQERERCATLVETHDVGGSYRIRIALSDAIRKG